MVNVRRLVIAVLSVACSLPWIQIVLKVGWVSKAILLTYMLSEFAVGVTSYWYTPAVFSSAVLRGADGFLFMVYFVGTRGVGLLVPVLMELSTLGLIVLWYRRFLHPPARRGYSRRA